MVIILALLITFKILFIAYPGIVVASARDGLNLWLGTVLPGILPFMIITNMLIHLGYTKKLGKLFAPFMKYFFRLPGVGGVAFFVGLTSGYPVGAKTIADLHSQGEITTKEAQHLLAFCNNAGPLFILGAVGSGMFGSASVGYILWSAHVIAAVIIGILLAKHYDHNINLFQTSSSVPIMVKSMQNGSDQKNAKQGKQVTRPVLKLTEAHENVSASGSIFVRLNRFQDRSIDAYKKSPGKALGDSVKNAMEAIVIVGGLIIFFSAIMAVLREIIPQDITNNYSVFVSFLAGIIEVTGGTRDVSALGVSALHLGIAGFLIAFSGLSIHLQTIHFVENTGVSSVRYVACKALHGIIAAAITIILYRIFMPA